MWPFDRQETQDKRIVRALTTALEERGVSLENPSVSLADPRAFEALFGAWNSAAGVDVTPEKALTVPAVWCAVNFIAGTIASLPLILYKKGDGTRERDSANPLYSILHDEVNDDKLTSFSWRKTAMVATLLQGRSYTFIERNKAGRVMNLWPLDPKSVTVRRTNGRRFYDYQENGHKVTYAAAEVIDIPFMLWSDGITAMGPVDKLRNAIGLALAIEAYASKFFQNGGVPPLSLQGAFSSPAGVKRASNDIMRALKEATEEQRNVLAMPVGYELKPIGFNPENSQLVEARLFQIKEIARIFDVPPVFLQDLTGATFSNTEQQDLHFVKHTLTQWLECWESELNAKLFTNRNRNSFVEFNVDGLLRGDFTSRMTGYASAVQNGTMTPDEVRTSENRPAHGGNAGKLFIQGATVPLDQVGVPAAPTGADPAVDQTGVDDGES